MFGCVRTVAPIALSMYDPLLVLFYPEYNIEESGDFQDYILESQLLLGTRVISFGGILCKLKTAMLVCGHIRIGVQSPRYLEF